MRRPIAMFVTHVVAGGESFLLRELHALERQGQPVMLVRARPMLSGAIFRALIRIAGIPELVVPEESGLLVDPANPRVLADAIRRVLRDPELRARLSARAKEKVAREFCLERCTAQLIELFAQ